MYECKSHCIRLLIVLTCLNLSSFAISADSDIDSIFSLSLEELLNIKVTTGARNEEELKLASSIITVITQEEIRDFGSENLIDVLKRLPSAIVAAFGIYPTDEVIVRGDRTEGGGHVLFLIDGRPFRTTAQRVGASRQLLYTFPVC